MSGQENYNNPALRRPDEENFYLQTCVTYIDPTKPSLDPVTPLIKTFAGDTSDESRKSSNMHSFTRLTVSVKKCATFPLSLASKRGDSDLAFGIPAQETQDREDDATTPEANALPLLVRNLYS